jgi:thiol-disulfide isomerase/thioredoxin
MDDKTIGIEVRMEEKVIPRDRISRIIWFHADETDPTKKPAEPPQKPESATRVQAVRSDGVRLTFNALRFADGTILGKSEILGDCKVRVDDLDQLLIGGAVEKEATQVAYQNFKLQLATEPKSALAERGELPEEGASAGTDSPMVGKDAPDFQLDLLGGKKFHLADNKGKVIVLDFWATWCGPCLQAMPQIDRATHDFADKGVQLIAVNLQETPAQITALLDRLKLNPTVALDRDGVVAARYGASAIPQTVIIDREGKVARLFIGAGPQFEAQLREALQSLMPAEKKE